VIPLSDDNPTLRAPVVTVGLLGLIGAVWLLVQGAGFDPLRLGASVCNLGLVPGELTGKAPVGLAVPIGDGLACVVDREGVNVLTPLTSMFLHGSWMHILGNALFLWVFGNNVEDSMGRLRFIAFYVVCGLVAAAAQVLIDPASPVPMVGASGAISGVMGAYVVLYPTVRVNMLFIFVVIVRIIPLPAWLVLLYWFGLQVLSALPELAGAQTTVSSGVAVMAHIGGFVAGALLVKLFENRALVGVRTRERHRLHPGRP
jgi:membrane associated rhomboid family serine protease